jgi:hypothetical protein
MEGAMTAQRQDYDDCLAALEQACNDLGPATVESLLLNGSLADGSLRVGQSDVLDAVVVLDDEVLRSEDSYTHVMERLVESCEQMLPKPVPFHAFHYYFGSEIPEHYPVFYQPQWQSDRWSRLVLGTDARERMRGSAADWKAAPETYFAHRRSTQRLAHFSGNDADLAKSRSLVAKLLYSFYRKTPLYTAAALGIYTAEQEVLASLAAALPTFPAEVFRERRAHFRALAADYPLASLRTDIGDALSLADELHEALMQQRAATL